MDKLVKFLEEYNLTDDKYKIIYDRFGAEIEKGLSRANQPEADTKCYLTYVQDLPTGQEEGKCLALDLGGTNFRVLCCTLKGNSEAQLDFKTYVIPQETMTGPGKNLFDLVAKCLKEFIDEQRLGDQNLPLGFTFSFPLEQLGLAKGRLVRWTKGFNCEGVVDQDVVQLLREAIERRGDLNINVLAILNDTTGTLMACAHRNTKCRIGVIVGTGSNACYVEKSANCELLSDDLKTKPYMIVNIEWGAFGEHGALENFRTDCDRKVDENSINKGAQLFEKMLSGMYLGELVRLVVIKAINMNVIFNSYCCCVKSKLSTDLERPNAIETKHLTEIAEDCTPELNRVKGIIQEIFCLEDPPQEDCQKLRCISETICRRAGNLIGVTLSYLMNKMNEQDIVIGVDGSVYKFHPLFDGYIREGLKKFLNPDIKFDVMLSEDGSGRGAALVAAVQAAQSQ